MDKGKGQASAESYKGRGVMVPHGLQASWIMEGAWVLEREFEVAPYISRMMVAEVLKTILPIILKDENPQPPAEV